jgi:hypothetical protein
MHNNPTVFKRVIDGLTPALFIIAALLLLLQRAAFTAEVFAYLMVAMSFRCLSTGLNLGVTGIFLFLLFISSSALHH